ncbi:hypothetical protein PsorP6_015289 [Peronosclerospora sorghi]|uniref:Uncharacterized protein n=1 Tax=Peronosclerospora sorghi TaxID=230839 RepID=A0ACC0VS81_9STRA|nr:hypothetical protein PsorP6_015289 [Peronosclerospora sorghi]
MKQLRHTNVSSCPILTLENVVYPTQEQTAEGRSQTMRLRGFHLLSALNSFSTEDSVITPDGITKVESSSEHINYVKQWTLTSSFGLTAIKAIDLSLSGTVYVSYLSDPSIEAIGFVNVSGNSRSTVDAVTVSNEVDFVFHAEVSVKESKPISSGYLLTEIFLATPNSLAKVTSEHSAQVVVEDEVLRKDSKIRNMKITARDTSAVYVSLPETDLKLRKLSLETFQDASIEFKAKSVSPWQELDLKAEKSSEIKLLTSSVETSSLNLESGGFDSKICISAKEVIAVRDGVDGRDSISIPNSSYKHKTNGTSSCKESGFPARDASKIIR